MNAILVHAPVLIVTIPVFFAAIICLTRSKFITQSLCFFCVIVNFYMAWDIFALTNAGKIIIYQLGSWPAPVGINYRIDYLGALFILLISFMAVLFTIYSIQNNYEIEKNCQHLFYALFLILLAGLLGICQSNDAFNIYVFLEIAGLSSYSMIAMGENKKSLTAAFQYLILASIGSVFYLLGIGFIFISMGTLDLSEISRNIVNLYDYNNIKAAIVFIFIGILIKVGTVPLHSWLPSVYSYAPASITTFMSAISSKVAIYLLIRYAYFVFDIEYLVNELSIGVVFIIIALASIIYGSFCALYQTFIRRILAFSSISNIGYILFATGVNSKLGMITAIITIINHSIAKSGLFMVVASVQKKFNDNNSDDIKNSELSIDDFDHLSVTMPWTMAALVVFSASIVGIPLTAGFISKLFLFLTVIDESMWFILAIMIITSIIPVIYMFRIVESAYFSSPRSVDKNLKGDSSFLTIFVLWLLAFLNIFLGINTEFSYKIAERIVTTIGVI